MRFPIDVSRLTFIAGSDPAGVTDMEGRQRVDKATGEPLWGLDLVALGGEDGAEVWPVRIAGDGTGRRIEQCPKPDAFRLGRRRHCLNGRLDEGDGIDWLDIEPHLA